MDIVYLSLGFLVAGVVVLQVLRAKYTARAKDVIATCERLGEPYLPSGEAKQLLLAASSIVLPRFYSARQAPANALSILVLFDLLLIPVAVVRHRYFGACLAFLLVVYLLRSFSFFSRNEAANCRLACLRYYARRGQRNVGDFELGIAREWYTEALECAETAIVDGKLRKPIG